MKFTLAWLHRHLDSTATAAAVADKLTALGLEVEEVIDRAAALKPFVVAEVLSCTPHPHAEKLKVCVVDNGTDKVQVVCGAPNARAGMLGVFAGLGATLPGTGLVLKAASIRGVDSRGMLCSEREMGLSQEHDGIIDLPPDARLGQPFASALGLDDPLFVLKVTPNRGDCLGVRGIARDLAASGFGKLKPLDTTPVKGGFQSPIKVELRFPADKADACPLFIGRYLRGVRNGPSPPWLRRLLEAIGLRPISALVDVTNFITYDLGRPLHVFDADTLAGGIHARLGRGGERILTLDGREYELDGEMCAICDDDGVLGLGGVMGGLASGCTPETTNVFIEAALFDPRRTAATGRRLGILSDARYRFERGVDPAFVGPGLEVATKRFLELCGGAPSKPVTAGATPPWRRQIAFRPHRVESLGGLSLPEAESEKLLRNLGFAVAANGAAWTVEPPSWRPDIDGEADLVEEVLRLEGYDAIPRAVLPAPGALGAPDVTTRAASPPGPVARPAIDAGQRRISAVRRASAARGLVEAVTYSFVSRRHAALFGGGADALVLANPISADLDTLRPTPLPALVAAMKRNRDRGQGDGALFEIGPAYAGENGEAQTLIAASLRAGMNGPRHWNEKPRPVDAFDAKADAMAALAACGIAVDQLQVAAGNTGAAPWYHPGRSGTLSLGPRPVLARFGEVHPAVLADFDLKGPLVACEVFLDRLPPAKAKATKARPLLAASDLPAVERDFAFIVEAGVAADALVRAARAADRVHVAHVGVFDLFAGAALGPGKKSLALSVRLQPTDKTFTDAEVAAIGAKIVAAVAKATGGVLRA